MVGPYVSFLSIIERCTIFLRSSYRFYQRVNVLTDGLGWSTSRSGSKTYYEKMKVPAFQYDPDYYLLISALNVKQQDYFMQIIDIIRYNKKELGYHGFVYKKKKRQEFYWVMPKRHLQTDKCDHNLTVRSTNTIVGHRIFFARHQFPKPRLYFLKWLYCPILSYTLFIHCQSTRIKWSSFSH
jgi:hypothetical protein